MDYDTLYSVVSVFASHVVYETAETFFVVVSIDHGGLYIHTPHYEQIK